MIAVGINNLFEDLFVVIEGHFEVKQDSPLFAFILVQEAPKTNADTAEEDNICEQAVNHYTREIIPAISHVEP